MSAKRTIEIDGDTGKISYPIQYLKMEHIGLHESFVLDAADFQVVEITGDGETGKTTILDAIVCALLGMRGQPITVTNGEDSGFIETQIAGVTIKRTIKDGKVKELKVRDAKGKLVSDDPQAYLEGLFKGAFLRPLQLYSQSSKEMARTILKAIAIDPKVAESELAKIVGNKDWKIEYADEVFSTVQNAYDTLYSDRTAANKEAKEADARVAALEQAIPDWWKPELALPERPASISEAYQEKSNRENRNRRRRDLAIAIADMEEKLKVARAELTDIGEHMEDTDALDAQIANFDVAMVDYNRQVGLFEKTKQTYADLQVAKEYVTHTKAVAGNLDNTVKRLQQLPAELLARADIPIKGLKITGDNIWLFDDKPEINDYVSLDERGDSEKLVFCVQIAMALAPDVFPAVLVDGCERLGVAKREKLLKLIKDAGFQALLTRVTEGPLAIHPLDEGMPADAVIINGDTVVNTETGEVLESQPPAEPVAAATVEEVW